jgi:FlaA1/EpsC-like NDP-sugar epimerase
MPDDVPFLHCSLRISRNWQAYIYRVVVTMFFIMIVACLAFRFEDGDLQDRLNFIATMLLTAVAFLFIVSGWLPQLKYLTLIDKYMMASFAFLTALAFQMAIFDKLELQMEAETTAMFINFGFIFAHHVTFAFYGWKMRTEEIKKLNKTRREIEASYEGTSAGQSKEQFICHTRVSKPCPFGDIIVYEGAFRDENSGWMMPS